MTDPNQTLCIDEGQLLTLFHGRPETTVADICDPHDPELGDIAVEICRRFNTYAELEARIAELEKPRLYVLGLSDMGCEEHPFKTERARLEFLVEQDDCVDDWYMLDIYPTYIDFNLVGVGEDAQEELDNLED